mmetsp:Transcript_39894/g.55454  ORF Transcript_39894/g.55454 Transcript_39894/m.55454 type:complete len:179 (-) Transcript_39894:123-659(-)|eukprot:CAMPEP_0196584948 /NCGR_PEP_ID=MMETSP1081-20130531/49112_1 /TAXON_ID=36882 /ORGANISM="Pyramimonas amylifera, Strain CCMP720" /LENGTH=178 /DNA_ID=CAMNT_0041906341 /DNA_START=134 /DNA_END=670 /DNA_ORIENTATION=-
MSTVDFRNRDVELAEKMAGVLKTKTFVKGFAVCGLASGNVYFSSGLNASQQEVKKIGQQILHPRKSSWTTLAGSQYLLMNANEVYLSAACQTAKGPQSLAVGRTDRLMVIAITPVRGEVSPVLDIIATITRNCRYDERKDSNREAKHLERYGCPSLDSTMKSKRPNSVQSFNMTETFF